MVDLVSEALVRQGSPGHRLEEGAFRPFWPARGHAERQTMITLTSHLQTESLLHVRQPGSRDDQSAEIAGGLLTTGGQNDVNMWVRRVPMLARDPRREATPAAVGGQLGHRGPREPLQVKTPGVPGREDESIDGPLAGRRPRPGSSMALSSGSGAVVHEGPALRIGARTGRVEQLASW